MTDVQDLWQKGFLEGWAEQGVLPTSEPSIPPLPSMPSDVSDAEEWAYNEGKKRGSLDRLKSQAGLAPKFGAKIIHHEEKNEVT